MDGYLFKVNRYFRCLPFSSSHPNHCKKNICTIVEDQQQKLRHMSELKENLKKYDNPFNIITNGIKKALEISRKELRKPKEKQTDEVLLFISTFDPNNPPVYNAIKNSV